jgi:anthranilate synthase component 1
VPPLLTRPLQGNLVPLYERVMADHLTPVLAYRCLVKEDDREAPSFLFESVTNGTQQGRYSFVGAAPALEVVSRGQQVHVMDHRRGTRETMEVADPMQVPIDLSAHWRPVRSDGLPAVFTGGWVGYTGYDTVRYVYSGGRLGAGVAGWGQVPGALRLLV